MKSTVSGVFEDLKFKISEGYKQNWCYPVSALLAVSAKLREPTEQTQDNFNFGPSLLKLGYKLVYIHKTLIIFLTYRTRKLTSFL